MIDPNTPGTPGTQQPPAATQNGGTGDGNQPEYLTKKEFGQTAAMIGGLQKAIKDMQAAVTNGLSFDKLAEIGLLEKDDTDGTYKPRASAPAGTKPQQSSTKGDDDPVMKEIKALKNQLAEKDRIIAERDSATEKTNIKSAVVAALQKHEAVNAARDAVHIATLVKKDSSGNYYIEGTDEYGRDTQISLDQFADKFLKDNPELKKASTAGGSGTPQSGARGSAQGGKTASGATIIPKAQWSDARWMQANLAKFNSGEYVPGQ